MRALLLLPLFLLLTLARAQTPEPTAIPPPPPDLLSLRALHDSLLAREQRQASLEAQLRAAPDEIARAPLLEELARIQSELSDLRRQFETIALATDISPFEQAPRETFDLQREIEQLIQPLLSELRSATAESRELDDLRRELARHESRHASAARALEHLDQLLAADPAPALLTRLTQLRSLWADRLRDAENQRTVFRQQLGRREADRLSLLERTRGAAGSFLRTRGRNLSLGLLAFLAVFLGMRSLEHRLRRLRPFRGRTFTPRLLTLLWNFSSLAAAFLALMAVFNLAGDWFLLSLVLVFLLGIGWAGIKTLPQFLEQVRMMLNIGAVRENDRLVHEGIPWRVARIGFQTRLVNPLLDGGELTLPTRMLVGLVSRPPGREEEWFPSRTGDWVLLPDGLLGRIAYQTPSSIQLVAPGGAQRLLPTPTYLALGPTILSTGFRLTFTFGIDYGHQPAATTDIPARMEQHLLHVLSERLGDNLAHLGVEFAEAADSSLLLAVVIDCKGPAAPEYPRIPRWAQAALVDLCTREGWNIPFPQLTLHRPNSTP